MQLPTSITRHGFIGMRDFRGEVIREFQYHGWVLHSEVCIWKDPVVAQQRTKSIRLLHKQMEKDSKTYENVVEDFVNKFYRSKPKTKAVMQKMRWFIAR